MADITDLITDAIVEAARALLAAEGADSQDGWHSWRCFDTARYPEPCDCTAQVARLALEAVAPLIAAKAEALREFAQWVDAECPHEPDVHAPPRPAYCCGVCPEMARGGYDCTCFGNPRCKGPVCPDCGHPALDHHGTDGRERRDSGCQINTMHTDWCRCPLTATEAAAIAHRQETDHAGH